MVIKAFKQFFIPHKHNDYKPHFFRELSVGVIAIVAIVLLSISAGTTLYIKNTNMTAAVLPAVLVDLTNNVRASNNEQTLTRNQILDNAAKLKAEDMARLGYFAHTSPSGITPWYWFDKAGYTFTYAGENLAINFTESGDVENAWLNSPTHKANILSDRFTEIGIATVDGIYQGSPTTYVVQMFGKPAFSTPTPESEEVKTPTPVVEPKKVTPIKVEPVKVAVAPVVKGNSVVAEKELVTITETQEFIAVKDNSVAPQEESVEAASAHRTTRYSTWYERFLFLTPAYTDKIYRVFIWIVLIALLGMTIIEVRRQHPKNIMYGVLLLVIMASLIYINKAMFVTSFIS